MEEYRPEAYQEPLTEEDEELEDDDEEEMEDVVDQNDILLNALLDLLITKGVISEAEFQAKVEEFAEVDEDDDEDGEEEPLGQEEGEPRPETQAVEQPNFQENRGF